MKKQTGVKNTGIGAITVKMGVRGTPRQDLAFRAHEMRILRRSMERPLPKKEGVAYGETERRKHAAEAFQTDRRDRKNLSRTFPSRKYE